MSKSQKDSINEFKSDQDSLSNKQLLNRKKKRDSNISSEIFEQNSISNNEIRCSICLGEEKLIPNCGKCITCGAYFHLECYNLFKLPETKEQLINEETFINNNYECYRCREEKRVGMEIKCFVCKEHIGIIKQIEQDKFLHHYCYVFFKDSLNNLKGGICKECSHKKMPVLKCQETKCKDKYHIQCAIKRQMIFWLPFMRGDEKINEDKFNDKINFFCNLHNETLINEFNSYVLTMQVSKKEGEQNKTQEQKEENNKDNEMNSNKKNEVENNVNNKEQKREENNMNNKEEKKVNEEKEKEIINSVINLNIANNSNKSLNINNNENDNSNEEKEKNNSISNSNNNLESVGSSPKTPPKIDLSKNSSKNVSNGKILNNSVSDIINVSIKKEKSNNNINNNEEDSIDINIINEGKMNNNEENEEDDEDMEYNPPEIIYKDIDLFENFKKMNDKYVLPASFCKFHY